MGQDKAFLQLQGRTLLDHALETARSVTDQVWIIGQREKFAPYGPVVEDVYRDRGPLAGIHTALRSSTTELNVILAIDTPFIAKPVLEYLIRVAEDKVRRSNKGELAGRR